MQYLFLVHKEKRAADILNNLHLPIFSQPRLAKVVGIKLQVYLAVGEGVLCLTLAIVPCKVGTYLIADILQKIALIFQGNVCLSFVILQANFLDQTAVFYKRFVVVAA